MSDIRGAVVVDIGTEQLLLLAERAVFRVADATLFVADLHVGKAATFRSQGVAIPPGTTGETLERLARVVADTRSRRLVILGDLLHAAAGRHARTEDRLARWCADHPDLRVELVRGNHDLSAGDPDIGLGIVVHDAPRQDGLTTLFHHPPHDHAGPWLAGHVHPAVRLEGMGRQRLTVPCFHVTGGGIVLPAFGAFTGVALVRTARTDRIFAVAGDEVVEAARPITPTPADPRGSS